MTHVGDSRSAVQRVRDWLVSVLGVGLALALFLSAKFGWSSGIALGMLAFLFGYVVSKGAPIWLATSITGPFALAWLTNGWSAILDALLLCLSACLVAGWIIWLKMRPRADGTPRISSPTVRHWAEPFD